MITARTALVVLATAAAGSLLGACDLKSDTTPGSQDQKDSAKFICEEFVDRTLKAPDTAEYGGLSEARITFDGDETYTVRNYVDAENSFGAKLRSNFTCKVEFLGGEDEEWQLVDLTGIDE